MVVFGMSMSLDGFIEDENGSVGALYPDFAELADSGYMQEWTDRTGVVLMGRRTFEMAGDTDSYADTYEHQGPIFVVTHRPPDRHPKENDRLTITFVTTGVADAIAQAKEVAAGKDISIVGGVDLLKQLLQLGLIDELHMSIMPVLLGKGKRLFEDLGTDLPKLEKLEVKDVGRYRTDIFFRILR